MFKTTRLFPPSDYPLYSCDPRLVKNGRAGGNVSIYGPPNLYLVLEGSNTNQSAK